MDTTQRKCTVCGNKELIPLRFGYVDGEPGVFFEPTVESFACTKCGHMEFFAKEEDIQRYLDRKEMERSARMKREADECELEAAKIERERLLSITEDENQTLKSIREAREKLSKLNVRIKQLEISLR